MRPVRPILVAVAILVLGAGGFGLLFGSMRANSTETDVINAYAARYVAETGGQPTDCAAVPGEGVVWLVVRCGGAGFAERVFEVDRQGQLVGAALGPST